MDSKPLVAEASALPTKPQPLSFLPHIQLQVGMTSFVVGYLLWATCFGLLVLAFLSLL